MPHHKTAGLTLVELMISMALGLIVVLATTALLLSTRTSYIEQNNNALLQETGRFALDVISRSVRQAAYQNLDGDTDLITFAPTSESNLRGLDARTLNGSTPRMDNPLAAGVINGSDALEIGFYGIGAGSGDGTVTNCAGFSVGAPASASTADASRGWSIFYVGTSAAGERVLFCKYRAESGAWAVTQVAANVDAFQVLYGVDLDNDGLADRYLNASGINALDGALVLDGATAAERLEDFNRKSHWKRVTVVKIALVANGEFNGRADPTSRVIDLFGTAYSTSASGAADVGVRLNEANLPVAERQRNRKLFNATIQLRNPPAGAAE